MTEKLRIGYIPLVDATALLVAVDQGFAASEGLDVELVREVSWSNVRDKLNLGLFDAAHLLSPVAVASSLGIGHVRVPLIAPFNLGLNGNAITVSPRLFTALSSMADGDLSDPKVSARALARVVAERKGRGAEPLNFGMTFPFSNHNYQLRFWMAAGGIDPDEDVRLVVLPPPYMVESLASGHVDCFCVGAPWNSVAVDAGLGRILHFGCDIVSRATEKVLAVRETWAGEKPATLAALIRALARGAEFADQPDNISTVSEIVGRRLDVAPELVVRTLTGKLKVAPDGTIRASDRYIMIGRDNAIRPDPVQAAWIYAQIARWGQAPLSDELRAAAEAVFRPDIYDSALGVPPAPFDGEPRDGIGAFVGPDFVPGDIAGHLKAWRLKRPGRPPLSLVR
jgi:ABC-type nitrate/sulfonate/bicarbonate transport system substrate-binding protein